VAALRAGGEQLACDVARCNVAGDVGIAKANLVGPLLH
jgi:hypothetical protein